jgi:hypothetical protein
MKDQIKIVDWAGNVLFEGHYKNKKVDKILDANRCDCSDEGADEECSECNGTGYSGDFEVYWSDDQDERNVYAFINY